MKRHRTSGFSNVELLVVVAVIGILLALLIPAVQQVRESSRRSTCLNNVRQLGVAVTNYEASYKKLPPGTNGFSDAFEYWSNWEIEGAEYYWKRSQHSSSLCYLMPFIELNNAHSKCASIAFSEQFLLDEFRNGNGEVIYDWFGEIDGFETLLKAKIGLFLCPSDDLSSASPEKLLGCSQPAFERHIDSDSYGYWPLSGDYEISASATNYLACAGAFSGGQHPDQGRMKFAGLFTSRESYRLNSALDGLSNTIMYGESIGTIRDGSRFFISAWASGGLARGRGGANWMSPGEHLTSEVLFGNAKFSSMTGFGSKHPGGPVFVFADGSTRSLSSTTDWRAIYQMCGRKDGGNLIPN